MRKVLGLLVVLCGIVSIAMTSRYGGDTSIAD